MLKLLIKLLDDPITPPNSGRHVPLLVQQWVGEGKFLRLNPSFCVAIKFVKTIGPPPSLSITRGGPFPGIAKKKNVRNFVTFCGMCFLVGQIFGFDSCKSCPSAATERAILIAPARLASNANWLNLIEPHCCCWPTLLLDWQRIRGWVVGRLMVIDSHVNEGES